MEMATLTSKRHLLIPKAIRTALQMRPGARYSVTLHNGRIVLEPSAVKSKRLSDWLPAIQVRRQLDDAELSAPVEGYRDE